MERDSSERLRDLVGAAEEYLDSLGLGPEAAHRLRREILSVKERVYVSGLKDPQVRQVVEDLRTELGSVPDNPLARAMARAAEELLGES